MKKVSVLVTGIGGGSHGEQIIKALKLSKILNFEIIGTDVSEITTGKKLVDHFYLVPYANDVNFKEKVVVVPFGLEKTVRYGGGTRNGTK